MRINRTIAHLYGERVRPHKTQQKEVRGEEQSDVFPASRVTACLAFPAAEITKLATRRRTDGIAMRGATTRLNSIGARLSDWNE